MRSKYLGMVISMMTAFTASAQGKYATDLISTTLKPYASAIIRKDDCNIDMRGDRDVRMTCDRAITILKETDADMANLYLWYNKQRTISNLKGFIYDANGKLIKEIKGKDFKDESAVSRYSLYEDDRVKSFEPVLTNFPITVEYQYEIRMSENLIIPDWTPNNRRNTAIENSTYSFKCPATDSIRTFSKNKTALATILTEKDSKIYTWTVANIKATKEEPYSPPEDASQIQVKIVPVDFSYYKKIGKAHDWNELGKWMYNSLVLPSQNATPNMINTVKDYASKYRDKEELAKALYRYMQSRMRYVSVQIGIGGYQPTDATIVDKLGYGDCKGLTNYMQTLLRLADIPSLYCAVNAGSEKNSIDKDFATMNAGNHVILAVPFVKDTLWLECTSSDIPAGLLGDFTDDRMVWASNSDIGKIIKTPTYVSSENERIRCTELWMDADGNLKGQLQTTFIGAKWDEGLRFKDITGIERNKALSQTYDIDHIQFSNYRTQKLNSKPSSILETFEYTLPSYAVKDQDVYYLYPNIWTKAGRIPSVRNRKQPLYIARNEKNIDTIQIHIPENIKVELPINSEAITEPFGSYSLQFKSEMNTLFIYRTQQWNAGTYPPNDYDKFVELGSKAYSLDRQKMALKKAR